PRSAPIPFPTRRSSDLYTPLARDPVKNLSQLLLPAIILGFALSASVMRMTRSMVLEVLREDYVRTAWAKGLSESVVIARHVLKKDRKSTRLNFSHQIIS